MEGLARTELLPLEMSISLARAWDGLGSTEACLRDILLKRLREGKLQHSTPSTPVATPSGLVSVYRPLLTLAPEVSRHQGVSQALPTWSLTLADFNEDLQDGTLASFMEAPPQNPGGGEGKQLMACCALPASHPLPCTLTTALQSR